MSSSRRSAGVAVCALLSLLVLAYSLVIAQQLLLGFLSVVAIWAVFVFFLLVTALHRIAAAVERLAEQRTEPDT